MEKILKNISIFSRLNKKEMSLLADFLIEKNYQKNDKIFSKGQSQNKLIVILKGQVALQAQLDGQIETIELMSENETLSETALINQSSSYQHCAKVFSDQATVLELNSFNWPTIVKKNPAIAPKIYQAIALRLRDRFNHSSDKLVSLFAVSKIISQEKNLEKLGQEIIEIILQLIPCRQALFATYSKTTDKLYIHENKGYQLFQKEYYDLSGDALLKNIIIKPETAIINTKNQPESYKYLPYHSNKSSMIAPACIENKVVAFIILGDKEKNTPFDANDQLLLESITRQIAPTVSKITHEKYKLAQKEMKNQYIDPFASF